MGAAPAVATFVPRFLAWSLGRAPATSIKNATPGFIAQTRARPPNITPAERHERIRVERLRVLTGHPPVAVVDLAPSTGAHFRLEFVLVDRRGRWLVSAMATLG